MNNRISYGFSIISNQRNPLTRSINRKAITYDSHIARYQDIHILAYTSKRRIKKEQIPPKMYILENPIEGIEKDLQKQIVNTIDQMSLNAMGLHYDRMQITSSYIFSKFTEKGVKELFQTYSSKILLNGRMPPLHSLPKYNTYLQQIISLYKIYYYGQPISKLQQFIESQYLNLKLVKFGNYVKSGEKSIKRRNELLKCIWNEENQRALEGYQNWQSRPFDDYGDFRPFFGEILVVKSENNQLTLSQSLIVNPSNYLSNKQHTQFLSIQLFNRLLSYSTSLQFTRILKLPVDYLIQLSLISCHIWMICTRLSREEDTGVLIKSLKRKLRELVRNKLGEIAAETGSRWDEEVYGRLMGHWEVYEECFKGEEEMGDLRGLVGSTVFLGKVDKYSDTVSLFSQYLRLNHSHLFSLSLLTILSGHLQFDPYLISPDYKSQLPSSITSYTFKPQHLSLLTPIDKPDLEVAKPTWRTRLYRWMVIMTNGLKSYDYYSQVEKQEKQRDREEGTGWEGKGRVEDEFEKVERLRGRVRGKKE